MKLRKITNWIDNHYELYIYLIALGMILVTLYLAGCQQPIEKEISLSETLSQLGYCPPVCPYIISCWIPNSADLNKR